MLVFVDFEASSLAKAGFPIEVGWAWESGGHEAHLIRPAPGWEDWDPAAETLHGISRGMLARDGEAHERVARRMVEALSGHEPCASAPSWDGKWLSLLLRAAGLPRHTLRLRASDDVRAEEARAILAPVAPAEALDAAVKAVLDNAREQIQARPVAHRAGADALAELEEWRLVKSLAAARAEALRSVRS